MALHVHLATNTLHIRTNSREAQQRYAQVLLSKNKQHGVVVVHHPLRAIWINTNLEGAFMCVRSHKTLDALQ